MYFRELVRSRIKKKRALITVGVLVFVIITLLVGSLAGFFNLFFLSVLPEYTVVPVKNAIQDVTGYIKTIFVDKAQLQAQIAQLENELSILKIQTDDIDELRSENERLRKLLDIEKTHGYSYIAADVVAMTPGNWSASFTINKGQADGIQEGMIVITGEGLAGRVVAVSPGTSVVQSIIDSASAFSVIVQRTRDQGIVSGLLDATYATNVMQMQYLPTDSELVIGDSIITSALEGVYPKGLLVGYVKEVSRQTQEGTSYVVVRPAVDFSKIEHVFVVYETAEALS